MPVFDAAQRLAAARRVVVKIGSALLIGADGRPHAARLADVAADIAALKARGAEAILVSSGAVAMGRRMLGLSGSLRLEEKQAAAAAGQARLMLAWQEAFAETGAPVAQILLTLDDVETRRRYLNARATIEALLGFGAAPVVNENDTVATAEIRYGDNDRLAAHVAQMTGADLLVLLSDVDGLYTADPESDPAARHLPAIAAITPEIEAFAGGANARAGVGSGGMATKVAAAKIATQAGCAVIIAKGDRPRPLSALGEGARASVFAARGTPETARRRWIAGRIQIAGAYIVDAGAAAAVRGGASLLPAGVRAIEGAFERGDVVEVCDEAGVRIAKGLSGYGADEARRIAGLSSDAIDEVLGYHRSAAVHRNDLAIEAESLS